MSLTRNIYWTLIGNVVYALCQWAMLAVLAKITDPQTVGQFALSLAITAPVFAFSNLQLREIQATDVKNEYNYATYLGFRIVTTLIAFTSILFILLLSSYSIDTRLVVLVIGVAKSLESCSDITYGLMQKYEQMHFIAWSMLLKGPLSLFAFITMIYYFNSLTAGCVALAVAWGCLLFCYDFRIGYKLLSRKQSIIDFKPVFSYYSFKKLFVLALPLGIVILLNTLNLNIPRYKIVASYGEAALGYYSAISYLLVAGGAVVTAIGQSVTPRLAKYYVTDRRAYVRLLSKAFGMAFFIGMSGVAIAWLFGERILSLLYTAKYAAYNDVLIWTMISALAFYCSGMLGCGISAARCFVSQLLVGIIVSCLILAGTYYFVPLLGIVGGAMALCVGFGFKLIGQAIQVGFLLGTNRLRVVDDLTKSIQIDL